MKKMNLEINNNNLIIQTIFFHIIIMLIPIIFWISSYQIPLYYSDNNIIVIYGVIVYVWCVFSWRYITKTILNPYIIFLTSLFVFTYGQSLLKGFGIEAQQNLRDLYSLSEIQSAEIFTILCICFFHLGALFTLFIKGNFKILPFRTSNEDDELLSKGILITGLILFCLSVIPAFSYKFEWLRYSNLYGYSQAFNYVGQESNAIKNILTELFMPSIFLMIVGGYKKKSIKILLIIVTVIWVLIGFASGDRGEQLSFIITFLWLWKTIVSKKRRLSPSIIIFGLIIITLIPSFTAFRNVTDRDLNVIIEEVSEVYAENNPIVSTVNELGYSMLPLIEVMRLIPTNFDYSYGVTYFDGLLKLLPTFLEKDFISYRSSLSFWLQDVLNLSYGPGFSMPAEAYFNFGWFGPFMFIFFGLLYGILFKHNSNGKYSNLLDYVFVACVLEITIMNTRESFINIPVTLFNYAVIPIVLAFITFKFLKRFNRRT